MEISFKQKNIVLFIWIFREKTKKVLLLRLLKGIHENSMDCYTTTERDIMGVGYRSQR